jgi:hypothetical protein
MADKIILGEKPDEKVKKIKGHIYLEDIEKAQVEGYLGLVAGSINYRDFLKFKNKGEVFYLEIEKFDEN